MRTTTAIACGAAAMLAGAAGCRSMSTSLREDTDSGEEAAGVIPIVSPVDAAGIVDCLNNCLCSSSPDCACFKADACPGRCNLAQEFEFDGAVSQLFCHDGVVRCDPDGAAWSFGEPKNGCGNGMVSYLAGRPDGSFCCASTSDAGDASAE